MTDLILKDRDIIVLSDDWGRHPFSCQHLMEFLIPWNKVLWVNTVGYRKLKFNKNDALRSIQKIRNWMTAELNQAESAIPPNLTIVNPFCIPFGLIPGVHKLNTVSIARSINAAVKNLNFFDPVFITTLPTACDIPPHIGCRKSIYYCVDDFTLWPGAYGDLIQSMEQRLIANVDLIIATSDKLKRTRTNNKNKTRLLTHGVDVNHFSCTENLFFVPELHGLNKPVVGYFGLIDERCDIELLYRLVFGNPDITFLIIGPWAVKPDRLKSLPNTIITGRIDYAKLPSYLKAVSVLILPYVVNEFTNSINPLKLKEYLATGLPVVATPLPEVKRLDRFIKIAEGVISFQKAMKQAFLEGNTAIEDRNKFLEKESWEKKAEIFSEMIMTVLKV